MEHTVHCAAESFSLERTWNGGGAEDAFVSKAESLYIYDLRSSR